jgi:acetoacetyl-CoA synthetase
VTEPLWTPSAQLNRESNIQRYLDWLAATRGLRFQGYRDTWEWSVTEIEAFWSSLTEFFAIEMTPPATVLDTRTMPGAHWFTGARLNYAQHALRDGDDASPAIRYTSEQHPLRTIARGELRAQVAAVATSLRELGVERGDRVAGYLPNAPEAVIALLACASVGAVWACCAPELGAESVIDRFAQIAPKVLIAADGYTYAGRAHLRRAEIERIRGAVTSLQHVVLVHNLADAAPCERCISWESMLARAATPHYEQLPFEHPLWILFSSGTTGAPKAIVHGHGGILLEHLKSLVLQNNMKPGDVFFWHTTTSWMMWNVLVSGLLARCTIVLYDGSPAHPDLRVLWRIADDTRTTRFGAGASFFTACMRAGLRPESELSFEALRAIGSTGSPLPAEAFRWIHESVKQDVWLVSSSGGTDVASAFLGACPFEPVYEGELQGPALGAAVSTFNEAGEPVIDEVGELVITQPMPSMPLYFFGDSDGSRYRETYFERWPGVWRHGDWVRITPHGSAVIYGRSDATLNRFGVRIGTSEIYRVVEAIDSIADSLIVGIELPDGGYWMPLFVVLREGMVLDDELRQAISAAIRASASPRHVPDEIIEVPAIPRTPNGKKMELPVKRVLMGMSAAGAGLEFFEALQSRRLRE